METIVNGLPALKLLSAENGWVQRNALLSGFVQEYFKENKEGIRILEAGCGRRWQLELGAIPYELTGVDICKDALNIRMNDEGDLDQAICGDLCSLVLPAEEYDMIYCIDVIEHIHGVEKLFENFFTWLKPKGLLIIVFPDRSSVFGFLTRMLPYWAHLFYYKYLLGNRNAGRPGFSPFPTYYDKIASRCALHEYCHRHGHRIALEYGRPFNMRKLGHLAWAATFFCRLIHFFSLGRLADEYCSLVYAIGKGERKGERLKPCNANIAMGNSNG